MGSPATHTAAGTDRQPHSLQTLGITAGTSSGSSSQDTPVTPASSYQLSGSRQRHS